MNDATKPRARTARWAGAAGLLAAGAIGGGVLAGTLSANAATSTPAPSSGYSSSASTPSGSPGRIGQNPNEMVLTGSNAAKATAAALKAVPGGTINRVETDSGDAAYEAHMTKTDGTPVTVKMDKNFNVTAVEAGMGK